MYYDIVPRKSKYRGIDRVLSVEDLPREKNKFKKLLEDYFSYLDVLEKEEMGVDLFNKLIKFNNIFQENRVDCEIIVFDSSPLTCAYGYELEFLGIDIVYEMMESLLVEIKDDYINSLLNDNGLCKNLNDISSIIPLCNHRNIEWKPCYVYVLL